MSTSKSVPKIIFIDDEESILSSFKRLFRKEAYEVYTTTDAKQVFDWVASGEFSVVISDQRMPAMEGVAVLTRVRELVPDTVRIILTGYADMQSAIDAINSGNIFRFLGKPWNEEELKATIAQAISQFQLIQDNKRLQELTVHQNRELTSLNAELELRVQKRTEEVVSLNKRLEKSFLECVKVMGGLAEYSGSLPSGHAKRVARLAGQIAKEMGLKTAEALDVQIAGYLHDIGKIGLGAEKTFGPEFEQHPVKGAQITRLVPGLERVSKIIQHHHERVDGTGFPDQLKDGQIPIGSKIIAVADAFDKLLHVGESGDFATPSKAVQSLLGRCETELSLSVVHALAKYLEKSGQNSDQEFEVEIGLYDLREGMVTSRPIQFQDGRLVLGADFKLDKDMLDRLWKRHLETPVVDEVFIYRKSAPAAASVRTTGKRISKEAA